MIRATFQPAKDAPPVVVELADGRLEEVLIRAGTRICYQLEGKELESHVARFDAVMRERVARKHKEAKRGA